MAGGVVAGGGGKKGNPEPRDGRKGFAGEDIEDTMAGKCLALGGKLQGAYGNLEGVRLEHYFFNLDKEDFIRLLLD